MNIQLEYHGDSVTIVTPHGHVSVSLDKYLASDCDGEAKRSRTSVIVTNQSDQPMVARNDVGAYPEKYPYHIVQIICAGDTHLMDSGTLTHPPAAQAAEIARLRTENEAQNTIIHNQADTIAEYMVEVARLTTAVQLAITHIEGAGTTFSERERTPVLFQLRKALLK